MKIFLLLMVLAFTGCGKQSDFVQVKIIPGLPGKSFHTLKREFFDSILSPSFSGARCVQTNIRVGYSELAEGGGFKGVPVQFTTNKFTSGSLPTTSAGFINNAAISADPIVLTVPRNKPIRIGMMGMLYGTDQDDGTNCIMNSSTSTSNIASNFVFSQATGLIDVQQNSVINMDIPLLGVKENPSSANAQRFFTLTSNITVPTPPAGCTAGCSIYFIYGGNIGQGNPILQPIVYNQTTLATLNPLSAPHIFPIKTLVITDGGAFEGMICKKDVGGMPTDPGPGDFTYTNPSGGNYSLNASLSDCSKWSPD